MSKNIKLIIILIFILSLSGCNKYDNFLSIHMIDVGQGDCILIKNHKKKNILIDGGDEDAYKVNANWTYKDSLSSTGYQDEATFIYVHDGKKLVLVEISDTDESQE